MRSGSAITQCSEQRATPLLPNNADSSDLHPLPPSPPSAFSLDPASTSIRVLHSKRPNEHSLHSFAVLFEIREKRTRFERCNQSCDRKYQL